MMTNKKLKNIIIILSIILMIILIISCMYVNRKDFISRITGHNQTLKTQENNSEIVGNSLNNVDISKWDLEKVNIVYDKDNVPVPVPKGFVASSVENGITPIGQEILEENRVNTGFVIYEMTAEEITNNTEVQITKDNFWEESQKRNQWVWVPVSDPSRIYERDSTTGKAKAKLWNFTAEGRTQNRSHKEPGVLTNYDNEKNLAIYDMVGMTQDMLLKELENEYEETLECIEKYGGFYIGRYETGNVGSGSSSNHNTPRKPVIQRMNTNINNVTWYDAYINMKNLQVNENVKSNVIWGSLWDETLQWLVESGSKTYSEIKNSVNWGNISNSEFDYITAKGTMAHGNKAIQVPTGSSEQNKANNIYDMAGNAKEWTLEIWSTTSRICRGGNSNTNNSVDVRDTSEPSDNKYGNERCTCISLYQIEQ